MGDTTNMELYKVLTKEQKKQLADELFNKLLADIKKIDTSDIIREQIYEVFTGHEMFNNIDYSKISNALTNKIVKGLV